MKALAGLNVLSLYEPRRVDNVKQHAIIQLVAILTASLVVILYGVFFLQNVPFQMSCQQGADPSATSPDLLSVCNCAKTSAVSMQIQRFTFVGGCGTMTTTTLTVESCISSSDTAWYSIAGGVYRGIVLKEGGPYVAMLETNCVGGVCFLSGRQWSICMYSIGGGQKDTPNQLFEAAGPFDIGALVPAVNCCTFSPESNVSRGFQTIAGIGGIATAVITIFKYAFSARLLKRRNRRASVDVGIVLKSLPKNHGSSFSPDTRT
eukprot:GILJ01009467.1.p1 GENE.GILJ01009467.1~~GILJ01009467.1.p1  ORF type:complete len:262 (-),score=-0.68 GILJ01009467.1:176-961(-)